MLTDKEVTNIIEQADLQKLAKQCLSIVEGATLKDEEIQLLVASAILDMERQGIDVVNNTDNSLVKGAIMMYVKANFGMVDIKDKKLAEERYNSICTSLSLSEDYKKEGDENV